MNVVSAANQGLETIIIKLLEASRVTGLTLNILKSNMMSNTGLYLPD